MGKQESESESERLNSLRANVFVSRARNSVEVSPVADNKQVQKRVRGAYAQLTKVSQRGHPADHGISLALQIGGAAGPGVDSASNGRELQRLQQLVVLRPFGC